MQFVITQAQSVLYGPSPWKKLLFESIIKDEMENPIEFSLPEYHDRAFTVPGGIKILPLTQTFPEHNPQIEFLNGPFYDVQDDSVTATYEVKYIPIESLKNTLKAKVTENRWYYEISGAPINIRGDIYTAYSGREDRGTYLQALQLGAGGNTWKFPEGWVILDLVELQSVVFTVMTHVQNCFSWESLVHSEIDSCTTHEQLMNVDLERV